MKRKTLRTLAIGFLAAVLLAGSAQAATPEIGARARANMAAGGGNHKSEGLKSGLMISPNPIFPVNTRKEAALAVGIGEQTMGRITQLAEAAPQALKDALDRKEVSINRGWKILKAIQQLPLEEQESASAEMLSVVREIDQLDAEAERRGKIAALFCKAYERAVLLTPTLENVRIWVENTRMEPDEMEDSVQESYELAQTFQAI